MFCEVRPGFRTWLGGRESLPQPSETPTKTGVFSPTRVMSANQRFRIPSSAAVRLLLFSDFANAMTLEMTLAPNVSRGSRSFYRRGSPGIALFAFRSYKSGVDETRRDLTRHHGVICE